MHFYLVIDLLVLFKSVQYKLLHNDFISTNLIIDNGAILSQPENSRDALTLAVSVDLSLLRVSPTLHVVLYDSIMYIYIL